MKPPAFVYRDALCAKVYELVDRHLPVSWMGEHDRTWGKLENGFVYFYWQQGRAHLTIGNERFWLNNPDEGPAWEEIERLLAEKALLDAE